MIRLGDPLFLGEGDDTFAHPIYVDLHAHSTASDGTVAPMQVIELARQVGLRAIALTDHDTVSGVPDAAEAGMRIGIRVISGCELSAYDGDDEVHLLALHITDLDAIRPRLARFRIEREDRAREMVRRLNAKHIPVSFEDVLREADGGVVGRPHVARVLLNGGYVSDIRGAFDRYLGTGRIAYVPKPRLSVEEAVAIAHHAGALAIWAHPGRAGTHERVRRLVQSGVDGVEVRHPSHTPEDVQRLTGFIAEFGIVPSGGSDWHGAMDGYRTLGNMNVPASWLDAQDARLAARAA